MGASADQEDPAQQRTADASVVHNASSNEQDELRQEQSQANRLGHALAQASDPAESASSSAGEPVKRKKKKKKREEMLIYGCDACHKQPLHDFRFHCTICKDFDLCMDCFSSPKPQHTPSHLYCMKQIAIKEEDPSKTTTKKKKKRRTEGFVVNDESPVQVAGVAQDFTTAPPGVTSPTVSVVGPPVSGFGRAENVAATTDGGLSQRESAAARDKPPFGHDVDSVSLPLLERSSAGFAGMAMEKMISTLRKCGVAEVPPVKLSTRTASDFNAFFQVGWDAFNRSDAENYTQDTEELSSLAAQVIALNAQVFAKLGPGKVEEARSTSFVDMDVVCGVLNSIVDQFMALDEHRWFCYPVANSEPDYHRIIRRPMDLSTVRKTVLSAISSVDLAPEKLYEIVTLDLFQIWQNAVHFNPITHPVHRSALDFARVCSDVLQVTSDRLELGFHSVCFAFEQKMRPIIEASGAASQVAMERVGILVPAAVSLPHPRPPADSRGVVFKRRVPASAVASKSALPKPKEVVHLDAGEVDMPKSAQEMRLEILRLREQVKSANSKVDRLIGLVQSGLKGIHQNLAGLANQD